MLQRILLHPMDVRLLQGADPFTDVGMIGKSLPMFGRLFHFLALGSCTRYPRGWNCLWTFLSLLFSTWV